MWKDPAVEEVRAIRDAYAKQFNYDLAAMARDLKTQEVQSGRTMIGPSPRKPEVLAPGSFKEKL